MQKDDKSKTIQQKEVSRIVGYLWKNSPNKKKDFWIEKANNLNNKSNDFNIVPAKDSKHQNQDYLVPIDHSLSIELLKLGIEKKGDGYGWTKNLSQYKQWKKLNFTEKEIREWINAGVEWNDYEFVSWLKNTKKLTPELISNYKESYWELSERFKKYGLCEECEQPNTGDKWCKDCNSKHLKQDFTKWTSNNRKIDKFIQKHQLRATEANELLEWIPYEQFKEIEYLASGGFGKVYKAKWTKGNIHHWDTENNQWQRKRDNSKNYREVVLKSLNNSSQSTNFLAETANHKDIDDWFNNIVPCYGLSQDPNTGNYLMVMQYMPKAI